MVTYCFQWLDDVLLHGFMLFNVDIMRNGVLRWYHAVCSGFMMFSHGLMVVSGAFGGSLRFYLRSRYGFIPGLLQSGV